MAETQHYELAAIDISGGSFTVEQTGRDSNFRPEYEARDATGDPVFRGTYNMYEEQDELPFVDPDGDEVFTVKASGTWDVAGDYLVIDGQTDEAVVVLDNDLSILRDTWRIRDPDDGSLLAEITSRGALVTIGRKLLPFGQWIAHKFEITDADGEHVGAIEGGFAIFDEYDVTIQDTQSVPTGPIVIGTVVIDAIQGN